MSAAAREAIRSWATIGLFSVIKGVVIIALYKAIAMGYSKPELLQFSQLYAITLILATLPSGITSTATIRYYKLNPIAFSLVLHKARPYLLGYLVVLLLCIPIFEREVGQSTERVWWLGAFAMPLAVLCVLFNIFAGAVANANSRYTQNGWVSVLHPTALCLTVWLGWFSIGNALLLACFISGGISFLFFRERKQAWHQLGSLLTRPMRWKAGKSVSGLLASSLISSAALPLSFYILRNVFSLKYGPDYAANMQAIIRVSESYMYVFGTVLSVYFFPRIAAKARVGAQLALFMVMVAIGMIIVYGLRHQIIGLLFSSQYLAFADTLPAFLLADFLRLIMFVLNLALISSSRYRDYLTTELTFFAAMAALTYLASHMGEQPSWQIKPFGMIYLIANVIGCMTAYSRYRKIAPHHASATALVKG